MNCAIMFVLYCQIRRALGVIYNCEEVSGQQILCKSVKGKESLFLLSDSLSPTFCVIGQQCDQSAKNPEDCLT